MRQFFKYVLATLVGLVAFCFLGFVLLAAIIGAASTADRKVIAANSVLELKLNEPLSERGRDSKFNFFGGNNSSTGLVSLKQAIRRAKTDGDIKGILLNLDIVQGGMASMEEVRNELLNFKKSGKFIVAYHEVCSEKAFYLSSVANEIYLHPQGTLEFNGLSTEVLFYKRLFDKAGIEPYIFRVGSFKSAVEPFFRENFSDSARYQTVSFLNAINNHMIGQVAATRGIAPARLKVISDSMLVHNASDALRLKMVTKLGYFDEVQDYMRGKLGLSSKKKPNLVSLHDYFDEDQADENEGKTSGNRIAVIYAEGDIVTGKGSDDNIGSDKFAEAIRKARLDDKVKAVVLRINSPGGSALASDIIYREVLLTKKVKPIIASMSDVAASGGYYIAMACDTIVAHPNSITGSIGVFGVLPNIQPMLANKLGITVDRVTTGKFSDLPTITRPLSDFEKRTLQHEVDHIYADFTTKAALGRHMPVARLRRLASGRVWSGVEAKNNGLVDVLGDYTDAVKIAAARAHIKADDFRVQRLPRRKTELERLLNMVGAGDDEEAQTKALQTQLGPLYPAYAQYQQLMHMRGVQARLPYEFDLQ
ncbi:signal peptide peptidase SppA [Hymenobacter sp. BT770]|uniref:signal peptide peptidase SppA n=1 Tax=Hymenobacter sp. BT770 TaxID=2886942 RepID=UPI001D100B3D|nr:signal peptide peptidase SppA [Hymenobacter sp. BT770]MCC3153957.1 signal peptide peptidase SppA [Hymenobacter sp. BT770]MDO3416113.1 signal peptide peptidase SppA [Hymenobacter sp. BT770]